ncbi:hypothetical protein M409DRAFT_57029 [Zasmidium cellare ATCC 36951]|uniref:Uncharacterized protein n=1 Tax=Zasmidium cellare ATCC 36951 TaxID=1080233 RepID=A0A6A6CCK8_ZASCE|nr:uncharacterized protein M409DRAFT_57029 [Zasmidium cellare ATCC 36951]KAF2163918.1 hypothetical protein M409DRAFT_57029 [Zasmidium cellare ATCC 36951]
MKKSSSLRRVPRKIGHDEDEEEASGPQQPSESVIKRPTTKPRKSTSLRQSLGPSAVEDEEDSEAAVITPKKSNVSRIAVQHNASKRSSLLASQLPTRQYEDDEERPSYSAASLQELKDSTPATPQNVSSAGDTEIEKVSSGTQALDISSKFGSSLAHYQQSSAIPSATEIAEKKARRARLAKEQQAEEFISLDPDDPDLDDDDDNVMKDEQGRLVLKPKDKYGQLESRLVADDEDIMENFDEFTEDGRIALGRKAEAEAARRRKQDMAAQIAEAEGASDAESDDSERERNEAFENAQTKHGTYVQNATSSDPTDLRPKTPPIITPLPTLDGAIERLRKQLSEMQSSRMQKLQAMEHLQREKIRLAEEEVRIQRALKETAEKFEALRKEKGIDAENKKDVPAIEAPPEPPLNGDSNASNKDEKPDEDEDEEMEDEDEEESGGGFAGLGFGGSRTGLGAGFGLGFKVAEDSEGSRS